MPTTSATRLSALDAAFLQVEDDAAPMHVGAVLLFDGRAPSYDELLAQVEARLRLLPRWRQRLAWPAGGFLRPCWVDDPGFDVRFHVRHAGLPRPHGEAELRALAGRLLGVHLDRRRPLWELHLVDGVAGDRFAVVAKIHHALADGVSGVDIATLVLDADPAAPPPAPPRAEAERDVAPPPSDAEVLATAALGQARDVASSVRGALGALRRRPGPTALAVARTARDATDIVEARLDAAPPSPYNCAIGATRRYAWTRADLAQVKRAGAALGATVNDVVLAAVAGALRRHLLRRGADVDGVELKAMIPVSVREHEDRGALGNRISSLYAPLPVGVEDAGARLRRVRDVTRALKRSGQAAGGQAITAAGDLMPTPVAALIARQMASPRLFNLTVTNIPGPGRPLYLLGRRVRDVFPVVPLATNHAVGIAIMSCEDRLDLGLLGCSSSMPDLDDLAADLELAFGELTGPPIPSPARSHRVARASREGVMNSVVR